LSESKEYQRLLCVCGKALRIPAEAMSKRSKAGKCPACNARFECRDGEWFCSSESPTESVTSEQSNLPSNPTTSEGDGEQPALTNATDGNSSVESQIADVSHNADVQRDEQSSQVDQGNIYTGFSCYIDASNLHRSSEEPDHELEGSHDLIRESIITNLRLDEVSPDNVAYAIAVACHPWIEGENRSNVLSAIASELRVECNVKHSNNLEIATDRLLRFSEALEFENLPELARWYSSAASNIESFVAEETEKVLRKGKPMFEIPLLEAPFGISNSLPYGQIADGPNTIFKDFQCLRKVVFSLMSAVAQKGNRDIGLACGNGRINVTIDQLAEHLGVKLPEKDFDSYLSSLNSRELDILENRAFRLGSAETLVDVALRWRITRERVRQIETRVTNRLLEKFGDTFVALGEHSFSPFKNVIFRKDDILLIARRFSEISRYGEVLSRFMVHVFGPWKMYGSWLCHEDNQHLISELDAQLKAIADKHGLLQAEQVARHCEDLFLSDGDRDLFLQQELGFGLFFGRWTTKKTMKCKVAAALQDIGEPSTKEVLAEKLQHSPQSVGSIMGAMDGVVRADRYRWGFEEWIDDPYDGIVGEIEQRIEEYNGSVPEYILLREIPSKFDVAEGSVRAYLASSAYVVENGMVRRAALDEYVPNHPGECKESLRVSDRWAQRCIVHERHFNGYSLGVSFDIAYANGLRPGDDLLVPIDGCDYQASLIWRSHNLNHLVDVGRISNYLQSEGYKAGDAILIIPSRDAVIVTRERELSGSFHNTDLIHSPDTKVSNSDVGAEQVSDPLFDLLGED